MRVANQCEAIALRTGQQCKNAAVGETRACEHPAHQAQVRERGERNGGPPAEDAAPNDRHAAEASAPPNRASIDNDRSAQRPAVDPELAAVLAELPAAPDSTADEIAATTSAGAVRDLGELERHARSVLVHADELDDAELEPAEIDAAAAARADDQASARTQLRRDVTALTGQWKPERVQFYLRTLINPRYVKDGKEPLDDDELAEGAELGARVLNDLFGARPENPYLAFVAWGATVTLTRYLEEVLSWIGNRVRRVRGNGAASSGRVQAGPADQPGEGSAAVDLGALDSGFGGVRH